MENRCNFMTCRFNKNGKCTNNEERVICVNLANKGLCLDDEKKTNNFLLDRFMRLE
jgi:hypothetical protein